MNISLLAIAAMALFLCACAPTGGLPPDAQADMANALALGCPVVAAVEGDIPNGAGSQAAYALLASVCPPNPAPTNAVVAAVDILGAYYVLKATAK